MYNWSTDEEKFKDVKDAVRFLKTQPDVIQVRTLQNNKHKEGALIKKGSLIKVKLSPNIHPAIKTALAMILLEKSDQLAISVVEE